MDFNVRLVPKDSNGTVHLAVDYDGASPPTQLFADLAMIGWQVPAPAPPPREAIDWSTPDPAAGQRFTLTSWQVRDQIVEPPMGSGTRGRWSAEETRPFMQSLQGVLLRHGLDVRPQPPQGHVAAAEARRPAAPILSAVETPPSAPAGIATIRLLIDPPRRILVEDELDGLPIEGVTWTRCERITIQTYRGSTYEHAVAALQVEVMLAPDLVTPVGSLLADASGILTTDEERFQVHLPVPDVGTASDESTPEPMSEHRRTA